MADIHVDILIAGGSIAGLAAAAALREFGLSVLIVEPGQRVDRRLAGELLHPLGVQGLIDLGLLTRDAFAAAVPIKGFSIFPEPGDSDSRVSLAYKSDGTTPTSALALGFAEIRRNLDEAARALDHVRFMDGAKVTAVETNDAATKVTIDQGGQSSVVTCRIVVAADGASSPVRALAGIGHKRRHISTITGYVVDGASLPSPGFGHVIIGGPSLVLAYPIGHGSTRVMFDQPIDQDAASAEAHRAELLAAIPAPFQQQVAGAMRTQKPLTFKSAEVIVDATSKGRVVLVGDAGGSCHPLTATGMTVGIGDALRLRAALRRHRHDVPAAFRHYDRARRKVQRSRRMVASALHDVCSRRDPEMVVVREGLIRYWREDPEGQSATMAILAMSDARITSAYWQFFKVARHGLTAFWQDSDRTPAVRLSVGAKIVAGLGSMTLKQLSATVRAR